MHYARLLLLGIIILTTTTHSIFGDTKQTNTSTGSASQKPNTEQTTPQATSFAANNALLGNFVLGFFGGYTDYRILKACSLAGISANTVLWLGIGIAEDINAIAGRMGLVGLGLCVLVAYAQCRNQLITRSQKTSLGTSLQTPKIIVFSMPAAGIGWIGGWMCKHYIVNKFF